MPEVVLNRGEHCGHEWIVVHNQMGFRCGYVKVEPGHPWHGKEYDDVEASVHGGLTFSEPDLPCDKGGLDDGYWFGFDCAHYGDAQDPDLPSSHKYRTGGVIRTQEYVEAECRDLCEQAAAAGKKS